MKGWIPILAVVLVGVTLFGFSTWDRQRRAEAERVEAERVEAARVAAIQAAEKAEQGKQAAEPNTQDPAWIVPHDCRELWKAAIENVNDAMKGRMQFDARKEEDYTRCVENTSDAEYRAWVARQEERRRQETEQLCERSTGDPVRCREMARRREAWKARANAPESVRSRLDADDSILAEIRSAIAIYYGRNNGKWPPSKEVVATLVTPSPSFQCPGNDFKYDPATGEVLLLIDDPSRC